MTAKSPTEVLRGYAHHLQLAKPNEWEAFVRCFEAYSDAVTVAVIGADQNEVLNKQGQAQAFRHLAQTFRNCHVVPQTETASSAVGP